MGKRNASFTINKLKEDSISKQFCSSLKLLSDTLDSTDPHYVRCMKPNGLKCPNTLHAVDLRSQLRNAGTKKCSYDWKVLFPPPPHPHPLYSHFSCVIVSMDLFSQFPLIPSIHSYVPLLLHTTFLSIQLTCISFI